MVSAAMATEEQHGGTGSDTSLPTGDKISSDMDAYTVKGIQSKEQFNISDDFAPKVRKPYTITKQRERWTDEEHTKFLEALKLYGRVWRKIEDHVGTKTAVQIRSHAQKFFSKVVRESNTGDASSEKPIEIPPPRPKRKPMHPYPRKMVSPVKNGISIPEKPTRSTSPDFSISQQENQSPTSVLSANDSDEFAGADSCMPNGSLSPVSSTVALNAGTVFGSKEPKVISEEARSSLLSLEDENFNPDEEVPVKLELLSQRNDLVKEEQKESAAQCLKLFGKTLLVKDPRGTSYSTIGTCKLELLDASEGTCLFPLRVMSVKFPTSTSEYVSSATSDRSLAWTEIKSDIFNTQIMSDKSYPVDACCPVPLPWLTLCGGASFSTLQVHTPTPIKARLLCDKKQNLHKDEQEERSSSGSNSDLVSASSDEEKSWDIHSCSGLLERKGKDEKSLSYKLSKRNSASSVDCRKGFVPYKRCSLEQDSTISSTGTAEVREKQRKRLCL